MPGPAPRPAPPIADLATVTLDDLTNVINRYVLVARPKAARAAHGATPEHVAVVANRHVPAGIALVLDINRLGSADPRTLDADAARAIAIWKVELG